MGVGKYFVGDMIAISRANPLKAITGQKEGPKQGDVKAFELIMRFIGDMPTNDEQQRTYEEIKENIWNFSIP